MTLEWWGMAALAGVCSGLVSGFLIASRNWVQFWVDRDRERLYQILVGLSQFQETLTFCEMEPANGQRVYLAEPVTRIKENARILHRKQNKSLGDKLYVFGRENLRFGDTLNRATDGREDLRAEKHREVDLLIEEVEKAISKGNCCC